MWLGAWVCLFCTSRRLIRRKWTVTYQCQYFTINSSISECDNKYETQNAEPEIGTDGSSQSRRKPRVDGYGSWFGPPRVSGSGFWTVLEPNRPVFAVQTPTAGGLPGPVANTTQDPPTGQGSSLTKTSYQPLKFPMIIEWAYSQLRHLPIHCIKLMLSAAWGSSIDIICTLPRWRSRW